MIFSTKKYLALLLLISLFGGVSQVKSQAVKSPQVHCLAVDASGGVTLTWTLPQTLNHYFLNYQVYSSTNSMGPFITVNPDVTNDSITTYYAPSTSANSQIVYYTVETDTGSYTSPLDTMATIFLNVNNLGTGVAQLNWNAVHHPLLPSSSPWYKIYRLSRYSGTWFLIDSVKSPSQRISYYDTITFCDTVTLHYRIEISDTSNGGCTSISNISNPVVMHEMLSPPQAVMDTVSVNPNGSVDISWHKSPKNNVVAYIIYEFLGGIWSPIDTVYGINSTSVLNYTNAGNANDSVLSFVVALKDSCTLINPGALSNPQTTILLKEKPDRCAQTNTLTWNTYENLAGSIGGYGIGGYHVYVSIDNGLTYQLLATTGRGTNTYIDTNLNTPQTRWYFVQVFDSAHHDTTASSNIVKYTVATALKPDYDYLNDASVVQNSSEIMVNAYIDTLASPIYLSGAGFYALQRSSDSIGGFKTINTIPALHHFTNHISFLDNTADPNRQSYRYQVITQDSCYHNLDTTNLGQTMYLTAVGHSDGINTLTWNDYRDWYGGPQYYAIYRSEDGVAYTLLTTIAYNNSGTVIYPDNIKNITQGQGTFYYYIMAVENSSNPYSLVDTSYSNIARAYQDPTVYIPNAFDPKGINKIFIPVGVFIDVIGYDLVIINRWGEVLFESNMPDIGWDGTNKGKIVPEGVYIYLLTYTSSKGEYFQRKGTVTLLK
ncbi:MAG TPA: gliding motility-associated C-terminal domain-containing protein [Bacteroidia bacterium]|jgi:gliding motility-associated-like protein|nr:gliding motility-associated C-terminal domain-containing protein [Bacteroidia bacterium]